MAANADTPIFKAIKRLIDAENGSDGSVKYVALRAFIDPFSGDMYIESVSYEDRKVCIQYDGVVSYTENGWGSKVVTVE